MAWPFLLCARPLQQKQIGLINDNEASSNPAIIVGRIKVLYGGVYDYFLVINRTLMIVIIASAEKRPISMPVMALTEYPSTSSVR